MTMGLRDQLRELCAVIDEEQGPITLDDVRARSDAVMPIDRPTRPMVPGRRGWLVAVAAAAVVLLVAGGLALLTRVGGTESPVATTPPTDPVSLSTWSRVPHDEAVFGGVGGQAISSVTVGGPGLVAVGGEWDVRGADTNAAVWVSPDGFTWSRVAHDETVMGGGQSMGTVIAGGPGLVAVGSDGRGIDPDAPVEDAAIWTSVDGYKWSRVPHEDAVFGGAFIGGVTVGGPGLVAVGGTGDYDTDGDAAVWTSVDGITWSRVPHDESVFGGVDGQFMSDVTVGGPGLVAVGSGGGLGAWDNNSGTHAAVWTSIDGITWSRVANDDALLGTGGNPAPMLGVTTGGPGLVAVGADFGTSGLERTPVWTSPDGITWTRVPDDEAVRGVMFDVIAGGPGLVAVGCVKIESWTPVVWTSVDGITWTPLPNDNASLQSNDRINSASIQGPYLVVVGNDNVGAGLDKDAAVWVTTLED